MYGIVLISPLILVLLLFCKWLYNYITHYRKVNIVSIRPVPFVGSFWLLRRPHKIVYNSLKLMNAYGPLFKGMGGFRTVVFSASANFTECVLSSTRILRKSHTYEVVSEWLGEGLLTSRGEKWAIRRKLLTPCFHFNILERFVDVFDRNSCILSDKLRSEIGKDSTDIYRLVNLCSLDIICEAAMGIKINAQQDEHMEYVTAVKEISNILLNRTLNPFMHSSLVYKLTRNYRRQCELLKILHGTTDSVIRKRRELLLMEAQRHGDDADGDDNRKKKPMALLDMLLRATVDGQPLTDKDIREEVDTFMFEGHDTTASGIGFALYNIAKYPDVQARLVDELRSVFGNDQRRPATINDLQNLKYLDLVIKESLRLYPPVPGVARLLEENATFGETALPTHTIFFLSILLTHRNPELHADPDVFDPERFIVDNRTGEHPYGYIPFSAGPRNCIGQKFAVLEMKSTISKVLRHYELLAVDGFEPFLTADMTLKSENGILIKIRERTDF